MSEPQKSSEEYRKLAAEIRDLAKRSGPYRDKANALAAEYELAAKVAEAAEKLPPSKREGA